MCPVYPPVRPVRSGVLRAVLAELARNAGRVLTHRYLLRAVWGPAHEDDIDYLRVAISALRRKLGDGGGEADLIVNEPAIGYRLRADRSGEA